MPGSDYTMATMSDYTDTVMLCVSTSEWLHGFVTLRVTLVVTETCWQSSTKALGRLWAASWLLDHKPPSNSHFLSSSLPLHTQKKTQAHTWSHMFFVFLFFFRQCPIFHFHRKQNKRSCTVEVQLSPWESAARRLCFFMSEFNDLCARCNVIGHGQNVSCRLPQKRKKKKKNRCPNAANQLLADNLQPLQSHHSY